MLVRQRADRERAHAYLSSWGIQRFLTDCSIEILNGPSRSYKIQCAFVKPANLESVCTDLNARFPNKFRSAQDGCSLADGDYGIWLSRDGYESLLVDGTVFPSKEWFEDPHRH